MQQQILQAEAQIRKPLLVRMDEALGGDGTLRRHSTSSRQTRFAHCAFSRFPWRGRIQKGHLSTRLQALDHSATLALGDNFYGLSLNRATFLDIGDTLSILPKKRLPR